MGSSSFIFKLAIFVMILVASGVGQHNEANTNPVAYVSEEDGGLSVIDLNTLKVIQHVELKDVHPRGLAITHDGKFLITANKDSGDLAIFSTADLGKSAPGLVKRVHIGENPEFVKINRSGERVFATYEPGSSGGPPTANGHDDDENGPPAQVASFSVGSWAPDPVSTAGHETEGIEFSHDGKQLLVANEAQDTIGVFDEATGRHIRDVDLKSYGTRPRGLKISPQGTEYAVSMESSGTLLLLDADLKVKKSVATGAKPYGLTFDRAGKRIFVAAAMARKLQVFSADSLQLIAETPVGQRCWHFTFTPDDSKVLMACGRSGEIDVVDANTYKPLQTIPGFKLPWGIVAFPRSYGSLGLP
jgi:DNA-binding beta-propeller fold protein YncE